eukprot:TRINITY_DN1945_c0_g1_i1.p1 TRINITY_DN1945_c0_g1~~TRINITY_DN1945_c0_g1_i1.p1  ORF type:complete len:314 (+),score=46.54 TRINITY_DN1945_c0_g1_i1:139-1080(+)
MQSFASKQVSTVHCKVIFGEEIRRIPLFAPTFAELDRILRSTLQILPSDRIIIKYKDDEEDLITLSSDLEIETAITLLKPNDPFRVYVSVEQGASLKETPSLVSPMKKCLKIRKQMIKEKKATLRRDFNAQFEPCRVVLPITSLEEVVPLNINCTLKNAGERSWPIGTTIILINKCKKINVLDKLVIPGAIEPGSSIPFSIAIKAPSVDVHKLKWKVQLPDGTKFGRFVIKTKAPSNPDERKKKFKKGCRKQRSQWPGCAERQALKSRCGMSPWAPKIAWLKEMGFEGPSIYKTLAACAGDVEQAANILASQQ